MSEEDMSEDDRMNDEEGCSDGEFCDWYSTERGDVHSIDEFDGEWTCMVTVRVACSMCGRTHTVCFTGEGTSI